MFIQSRFMSVLAFALAPIVDWWQPWERRLVGRASGPEEIAYCRSTGKTVTPYLCSRSGNTDPNLEYHRFRGIRSFWMGYDGFGTLIPVF